MQNNQAIPFNKENFKLIFSKEFALVIVISVPSAIVAEFFNIPLAWFLGPMLITSVASLMGLKIKMPKLVLSSILILLGLYIGNYIDKSLFSQMHQWAWTSLIMLIYIITSVLIVSKYLQIFSKYEKKTSIFSAAPGALGPLLILAEDEKKTDLSQVATSHLIRLIIIITVFPLIVNLGFDPIWWGVINVIVMEIGMITPPIGMNVFVMHGMAKHLPITTIFKGVAPFAGADLVRLALVTCFPAIALWLPEIWGYI